MTYVNQRVNGAVTATSGTTFVSGQNVSHNVVRVDQREIVNTRVVAGAPAIAPTRQTFIGAGRPAVVRPPATVVTRTVVAKAPPPPPPVSVDRQEAAIKANAGRPIARAEYRQLHRLRPRPRVPPLRARPEAMCASPPLLAPSLRFNPNRPTLRAARDNLASLRSTLRRVLANQFNRASLSTTTRRVPANP